MLPKASPPDPHLGGGAGPILGTAPPRRHAARPAIAACFATATLADPSTVEWDGDEDLVIDSLNLALLAEQQRAFGKEELLAWQASLDLSNQAAVALTPMRALVESSRQ